MRRLSLLDLLRVWAAGTGVLLAVSYLAALYFGMNASPLLPMLVSSIGGFELFLFTQDLWLRWRGEDG